VPGEWIRLDRALTTFVELGLAPDILRALDEMGYAAPTPIQAQVIPLALQGGDILGAAQTGTGKTAAFALPLIQRLLPFANTGTSPAKHPIRALILTPTRELAIQVEESIHAYCKHVPLRSLVVYGGVNINTQIPVLKTGVEILVATPGRLLDHVQNKTLSLTQVNTLVLDEADRMLDMGFMPDLKRIVALLPENRVNMMFSATFPEEIRKLADSILNTPTFIEVARNTAAVTVTQVVHPVHHERKRQLLSHLIKSRDLSQVLVFTGTKLGCNRLANELNKLGLHADAIHGDKTQQERIKALDAFKTGSIRVLVATDVAARGIDIAGLPMVISAEIASDTAGTWKKALASAATRIRITPANRNLPRPEKSRLVVEAMPASTKKIAPVPPAAMAMMLPPLEKPSATCRMRDSIRPMKKVNASSTGTPAAEFLVFSMAKMKPKAPPRKTTSPTTPVRPAVMPV